jgi:hypothetical protein
MEYTHKAFIINYLPKGYVTVTADFLGRKPTKSQKATRGGGLFITAAFIIFTLMSKLWRLNIATFDYSIHFVF